MLIRKAICCRLIASTASYNSNSSDFSVYIPVENHLLTDIKLTNVLTIIECKQRLDEIIGTPKCFHDKRPEELLNMKLPKSQDNLQGSRMLDSYIECVIPFSNGDHQLQERYGNLYDRVRIGRILEDLDLLAVLISFQHNIIHYPEQKHSPYSIVTASVDHIDTKARHMSMPIDKDVILRGHITWVGKTSMEVTMEVTQSNENNIWQFIMIAKFVMVALDPSNQKSAIIHPLSCLTDEERNLFAKGESLRKKRMTNTSLLKEPPTADEIATIHKLFLQSIDERTMTLKNPIRPPNTIWMSETVMKSLHVCFPQDRNMYNKIFGGFLMREAYDLAWATHIYYTKRKPICKALADISFRKPVEIGSLLSFVATVVYTKGQSTQIKVNAEVYNPLTDESTLTNTFQITFMSEGEPVKQVMPTTYLEFMMFVDGKRFYKDKSEYRCLESIVQ